MQLLSTQRIKTEAHSLALAVKPLPVLGHVLTMKKWLISL